MIMNKYLSWISLIGMVIMLASCQESLIIDKNHKVQYVMSNDTSDQVSVTSYNSESINTIIIAPSTNYTYWQEIMSGTIENGKIALFSSDSLDIRYGNGDTKRLYAQRYLQEGDHKGLESMWVSSNDGNTLTFSIIEGI